MTTKPNHIKPLVAVCILGLGSGARLLAADVPAFSDDFESGSINTSVWDIRTNNQAEVKLQSAIVHGGKYALQVHYPMGVSGSYGFIVATHLPDSVRTHCFGRAYMYITPGMPGGHDPLLSAGGKGWPISNFLEIGASGGKNVMASYQQNAANIPRNETISSKNPPYPVGKWFCLEWEFSDHPDAINVWIDGQPSGELKDFVVRPRAPRRAAAAAAATTPAADGTAPAAAPVPAPPEPVKGDNLVKSFDDFAFGFRYWGSAKAGFDIYYDDIAIDTKRIGPTP
jgi:hypothetical protein